MNGQKAKSLRGSSPLAEYQRIEIELRQQIGGGQWPVGAMLPSRRDLARQHSVSLVTLDRAIGPLLADGTLRADDRRGTFVARLSSSSVLTDDRRSSFLTREEMQPNNPTEIARTPLGRIASIGMIASVDRSESQDYFIIHELEQIFCQKGHPTLFRNRVASATQSEGLAEAIKSALRENIDALIVVCLDMDRAQIAEEISQVDRGGIPTVYILAGELNLALPHVFYDNRSGGYQATQHMIENGWNDITVIAPFTASWVSERIAGVRDAASYARQSVERVQILNENAPAWDSHSNPRPQGSQVVRDALAAGWRLGGGIICVNDGVAFGVMDVAAELGLKAGRDFAILGFDDEPTSRTVGLTSLRTPMQGMAREAARLVLEWLQGSEPGLQVRLRAQVIGRASTRRG